MVQQRVRLRRGALRCGPKGLRTALPRHSPTRYGPYAVRGCFRGCPLLRDTLSSGNCQSARDLDDWQLVICWKVQHCEVELHPIALVAWECDLPISDVKRDGVG